MWLNFVCYMDGIIARNTYLGQLYEFWKLRCLRRLKEVFCMLIIYVIQHVNWNPFQIIYKCVICLSFETLVDYFHLYFVMVLWMLIVFLTMLYLLRYSNVLLPMFFVKRLGYILSYRQIFCQFKDAANYI